MNKIVQVVIDLLKQQDKYNVKHMMTGDNDNDKTQISIQIFNIIAIALMAIFCMFEIFDNIKSILDILSKYVAIFFAFELIVIIFSFAAWVYFTEKNKFKIRRKR